jgi:uncharacterized RDD family membrane protein YckC
MAPLTAILYFAVGPDPQTGQAPSEVKFVIVPLLPLYSAILHAVWHGQTVGKRLLGIAVREVNGAELGLGRSFVRSYFRIVLVLFPLAWMVDALSPLWDRRNRSFHDHVAGTIVVRPIRPPAPQAQSLMRA